MCIQARGIPAALLLAGLLQAPGLLAGCDDEAAVKRDGGKGKRDLAADVSVLPDQGGGWPDRRVLPRGDHGAAADQGQAGDAAGAGDQGGYDGGSLPTVPTFKAPLSWDFDGPVCTKLAKTGDWQCGKISFVAGADCSSLAKAPTAGHSGQGMYGTVLNDCYTPRGNAADSCSNKSTTDDSILSFKVSLPASWTTATLTFYSWDDYFTTFDWAEIRVNGGVEWQNCTTQGAFWTKRTVDLSAFKGTTVTIAFHFMATASVNYAGWYIDDLSVSGS